MDEPYVVTQLSPMRKAIATRMSDAKRTIPHFRLGADVELDALLALRAELCAAIPERRVSLNDLLIKGCAQALMDVPQVNAQWVEQEIRQYKTADISIVMAVRGGLTTPIVRCAESKSVWEISSEIKAFSRRAARNELKMDEIVGGSFSISNLGMYDVDEFDAIINPPQCAILAIGTGRLRCVALEDGGTRVATKVRMTLSADHRAIDGVTGGQFLSALRRRIEQPSQLAS